MSYPREMLNIPDPDPAALLERRRLLAEYLAENPDASLRTLVADALAWRVRQQSKALLEDEEV